MTASVSLHRWAWSGVVVALFAVVLGVLGWLWVTMQSSSAAFADAEILDANHLGAGVVDIAIGDDIVSFAAQNMAAGDVASGTLEVVNGGTLPLLFELGATSNGGPLLGVLDVVAWHGDVGCASAPPASAVVWRPLATTQPVLGEQTADSPTAGRLDPGESSLLCLRAELPLSATSEVQGQRLDLLLTVSAVHDIAESERLADAGTDGSTP